MNGHKNYIPIDEAAWNAAMSDDSYVADISTDELEKTYERQDLKLNDQIKATMSEVFGSSAKAVVFVGDDWWPNRTRYVDINSAAISREFVEKLRALLSGAYSGWRISVIVYSDMMRGTTYVGAVLIHSDRVLVEDKDMEKRPLLKKLNRR